MIQIMLLSNNQSDVRTSRTLAGIIALLSCSMFMITGHVLFISATLSIQDSQR